MKLDEAIKHCEEVAEEKENHIKSVYETLDEERFLFAEEENECKKCAEEHKQLAEWLKDYKRLLEREPCEDCVSRKQAHLALTGKNLSFMNAEELIVLFNKRIKALPPVTPQPKTGKWIDEFGGCECSKCGRLEGGYSDYCPNCGAKMESEG